MTPLNTSDLTGFMASSPELQPGFKPEQSVWARVANGWRSVFLRNRLFHVLGIFVLLFALSFAWSPLFVISQMLFAIFLIVLAADLYLLFFRANGIGAERELPRVFSLGEEQHVLLKLSSKSTISWTVQLLDELPFQFQIRDFNREVNLLPGDSLSLAYSVKPLRRGIYRFGKLHAFLRSPLALVERRLSFGTFQTIPVYPSINQMHRFELLAMANTSRGQGLRKIRRIGHSYEFEQIKTYVAGDDRRAINWKATGKRNSLMVNQYEDERSQHIYCALDTGRSMKLPFDGMSLLDYAVNASLALSNVALHKHDRCGLVCFDKKVHTAVLAERKRSQLPRILEALYRQEESTLEADFEGFYHSFNRMSPSRSLVILFSNFESDYALQRALPVLKRIQHRHVLLLVLFENTELTAASEATATDIEGIYRRTLAAGFLHQKKQMALRAAQAGIQTILTRPEDLSANTINKYLELKSRGMI